MVPDEKTVREAGMPYTLGLGGASDGYGRVYGRKGEGDDPPGPGAAQASEARGGHTGHDTPGASRAGASAAAEGDEVKGAATITATYVWRPDRKKFRVLIRPANGPRLTRHVRTEQDAIDLVRHFNRLGIAGVRLPQCLSDAQWGGQ